MKKNIFLNTAVLVIMFIVTITPVFAKTESLNNLSKVIVEKSGDDFHKINLVFDKKYQGNAFIQTRENGHYSIFLPDTSINMKKTKVSFKNKKEKNNFQINFEEKPFITDSNESSYVKVAVKINDTLPLKIISNTTKEASNGFMFYFVNILKILGITIAVCILISIGILILSMHIKSKNSNRYRTNYSSNYRRNKVSSISSDNMYQTIPETDVSALKPISDESFTCFDITGNVNNQNNPNNYYEFKRTLNKVSSNKLRSKNQTNPIVKKETPSELQIPVVEDINIENSVPEKKEEAELISVLNITPKIGFYLTNVGETMALFGFVKDNVFLFKKFNDLSQINLQARFYDKHGNNDLYIVKLDSYKAMIEISDNDMKELAVL